MLWYSTRSVCLLSLLCSLVQSDCERGGTCDDADIILRDLRADPKSYQQLLQAFYPVNKAQPAYMVIAYFINFTGTFPEVCDGHTYPWTTFPNFTTTHIQWFLWTTIPANNIVNIQILTEYGLSVPAQSYYALFNTSPWWLTVTTTTACVALPYNLVKSQCTIGIWCFKALDKVTAELMSVVSDERYRKELMDECNPGVLEVYLGKNQQCYTVRSARTAVADRQEGVFYWMVVSLGMVAPPILLYITWRKQLAVLQKVKVTKGGPAVMWACISWMPLANLYFIVKFILSTSHFSVSTAVQRSNDVYLGIVVAYLIVVSSIAAVIQSGRALFGLPNSGLLRSAFWKRMVNFIIWSHFNVFVSCIFGKAPFVVLIVGTNPFLYGSALLAIFFAISFLILTTAALFTFGQVFLGDPDFRLSWREAVWQAGMLLLLATSFAGMALFLGCISFLLLLSKGGNKVQSVSGVASFFMSHVVPTVLPLLVHSLIRFIRNVHP